MRMEVAENHKDVDEPISEFFAFDLLGVTYTTSFCCR
jgi:hypothetical protein